jgi:hypothetical protein
MSQHLGDKRDWGMDCRIRNPSCIPHTALLWTHYREMWGGLDVVLGIQNAEKCVFCFSRGFRRSFCEVFVKRHKELAALIFHSFLTISHFGDCFRSWKVQTCRDLNNVVWITSWCCNGVSLCNVLRVTWWCVTVQRFQPSLVPLNFVSFITCWWL